MKFIAIDVETANADQSSICQFGFAAVKDGEIIAQSSILIDPRTIFDGVNISIHGIRPEDVIGYPVFPDIWPDIYNFISDFPIVSHSAFDRVSLMQSLQNAGLPMIGNEWIDSMRVIRRIWPDKFRNSGYGLANACAELGIPLINHHNAEADAVAAASLILKAGEVTGLSLQELAERSRQKIRTKREIVGPGAEEGPLLGEVIVFTGAMQIPRREAAAMARKAGAEVASGVTRQTTILVIGDAEAVVSEDSMKTTKHKKAEELVRDKKANIHLITEYDFVSLIKTI